MPSKAPDQVWEGLWRFFPHPINFDGAQQLLKADFGYFLFYSIICAAIIIRLTINDAITLLTADGRLFRRAFSLNLLGVSVCRLWLLLAIASRIANWHPCNWNSVCKLATRSPGDMGARERATSQLERISRRAIDRGI